MSYPRNSAPDTAPRTSTDFERIARLLLGRYPGRSGFQPQKHIPYRCVVEALRDVLAETPPRSEHGQLLAAALSPKPVKPAPREQVAVRRLLARGQRPTPAAVATEVANLGQRQETLTKLAAKVAAAVRDDGPHSAQFVAEQWATTGIGPTWQELSEVMGWRLRPAARNGERTAIIRGLVRAGWLIEGRAPRSLRPGPRYRRDGRSA